MPLAVTVAAALVGAALFEALRVPAGALVGAMVAVALVNVAGPGAFELPAAGRFVAFAAVGWLIGARLTTPVLRDVAANLPYVAVVLSAVLVIAAVAAFVGVRLFGLDLPTAVLASAPGGLTEMSAIGAAVGANVGIVVSVHLARLVSVIVLSPLLLRVLPSSD